ncbi:hypothetical protein [Streptosporangium vulgare]|uniref:hypothetical protein n=1 Tax=Streptosporangium vulgare TaxID=46190 RepID=UPI0031D5AA4B
MILNGRRAGLGVRRRAAHLGRRTPGRPSTQGGHLRTARIQSHYSGLARALLLVRPGDRVIVGQSVRGAAGTRRTARSRKWRARSPRHVVGPRSTTGAQVVAVGNPRSAKVEADPTWPRRPSWSPWCSCPPTGRVDRPRPPGRLEVSTAPAAAFGLLRGPVDQLGQAAVIP